MKVLALETSGMAGSVALWTGAPATEPRQWLLPTEMRSARTLGPAIEQALVEFGWKPSEIELVAVTSGPGSFTGLRVGVVTAKAFAYAVGCPVIGVNTLEVISRQAFNGDCLAVTATMDAQRGDLFVARFDPLRATPPTTSIQSADAWLSALPANESVTGPGLEKYIAKFPKQVCVVEQNRWQPLASTVALIGLEMFLKSGDIALFHPFALTPQYFRRTAAEEQWEKRHSTGNLP